MAYTSLAGRASRISFGRLDGGTTEITEATEATEKNSGFWLGVLGALGG